MQGNQMFSVRSMTDKDFGSTLEAVVFMNMLA